MKDQLDTMFDYQSFEHNERIDRMLFEAEERVGVKSLDDSLLDMVAGGVPDIAEIKAFTDDMKKEGLIHGKTKLR